MLILEEAGIGVKLSYNELTSDSMYDAINEVLENPFYQYNVRQKSKLFRSQPQKPVERAVFWINWTLDNSDLVQEISSQYNGFHIENSIDIFLFIIFVLFLFLKFFKTLFSRFRVNNKDQFKNYKID